MLKNAGLRLPVEKKLGFELKAANKLNFSKTQKVKEALENSGATTKVSDLEILHSSWYSSGRATMKKTWYALPASKDDVNAIVAHAQQKKEREARKMLAEFGVRLQRQRVNNRRVKLTRFLPHGEVYSGTARCVWGYNLKKTALRSKTGRLEINFRSPMKVVGVGFRALKVSKVGSCDKHVMVAPVRARVLYQTFNSNTPAGEWVGTRDGPRDNRVYYNGPRDGTREVAHNLHISNCKALKIEALDLVAFGGGSLKDIGCSPEDSTSHGHHCFEVFVYGSPETTGEEEEEEKVPVGSGCIRNRNEVQDKVTVVCLSEPDTVAPRWSYLTSDYRWYYDYGGRDKEKKNTIPTDQDFVVRGSFGS